MAAVVEELCSYRSKIDLLGVENTLLHLGKRLH